MRIKPRNPLFLLSKPAIRAQQAPDIVSYTRPATVPAVAGKQGMKGTKPKVVRMVPRMYKRGWLHALDRRSGIYLALTARLQELMQDLGGEDNLSYQQRSLCKRAIWIEARLMAIEEEVAGGG